MAVCERCGNDAGVVTVGQMSLCAGCGASVSEPAPAEALVVSDGSAAPDASPLPSEPDAVSPYAPTGAEQAVWQPAPPVASEWGPGDPAPKKRSALAIVGIVVASVLGVVAVMFVAFALVVANDDKDADEAASAFASGNAPTVPYTAADGNWSIAFPSEPSVQVQQQPVANSDLVIPVTIVSAREGRLYYFEVSDNTVPEGMQVLPPEEYFQATVAAFTAQRDGTVLSEGPTNYGLLPAYDFTLQYHDGNVDKDVVMMARMIYAPTRQYGIVVVADEPEPDIFDRFAASFTLNS